MIILYRTSLDQSSVQPIVIVDYTRSDEQWTTQEIDDYVKVFQPATSARRLATVVYSLDYSMIYTHTGIQYGDSLKTRFEGTIKNAPIDLVNLLNIQQYTSQQNLTALSRVVKNIIDPQVQFPSGGFVIKNLLGEIITRPFIIYSTPYNFDAMRLNSNLILKGAAFDSMVIRLEFAVNIDKKNPLLSQMSSFLKKHALKLVYLGLGIPMPAISRYYAPSPANALLGQICLDNNLAFAIVNNTVFLQPLSPDSAPSENILTTFSFANYVKGSKLMSTFSLNNYASCEFESEICDVDLFTSVAVYDDSFTSGAMPDGTISAGIFGNLTKIPGKEVKTGKNTISAYRFYVQDYTYMDSRMKTSVTIKGTNNWLISNFKIDNLLENAIYKNQLNTL